MLISTDVPGTFNQTSLLLDRHLKEGRGKNTAIVYEDKNITYGELAAMVNRAGNVFKNLGVEIENRVTIMLPDIPEFIYSYLGAMKIGAVPVPLNNLASPKDLEYFLNDTRAKVVVVSQDVLPKVSMVKEQLKYLRHIIVTGGNSGGYLSYEDLTAKVSESLEAGETSNNDMAFWMYTSGTTGFPKGVVHLQHDIVYYMPPICEKILNISEKDILFSTSRMFFSYGRNNSIESTFLYGAAVLLYPGWPEPQKVLQVIVKNSPTVLFSVPTFYAALLRECSKTGVNYDLSSVRFCVSSGEALSKNIYDSWKSKFGLEIINVIGSTDVGGEYLADDPKQPRPGSSGKLLPGFEGKLRDSEGKQVLQGEVGTLWLKNDGIVSCYWNKHQRSREAFEGEWFRTGDLFYQDPDGYFWFQGREDDMLKVSGQWVSPLEIEEILQKHTAVRESGVIGFPDESGLTRIAAFVALNEGCQSYPGIEKELADLVHDQTAHFKTPSLVQIVPELPRTVTGKLQRYKLRQQLSGMEKN